MRASEFLIELRDRMYQYIRSIVPTWPEYVVRDWLYKGRGKNKNYTTDSKAVKDEIIEMIADAGLSPNTNPWQLVPNMKFTMDMFHPLTKQKLIGRAGGTSDLGMGIPKDKERHATQAALIQRGGVSQEPAILIKTPQGYELLEGWHRTIQHFARYPDGYTGPAYVAVSQVRSGVAENMDHSQDSRAVEELRAALLAKKDQLQSASDDQVYDIIDKIMTRIARSHSISGQKLHDMWVDRYKQIPDTWIMNEQQDMAEEHADQKRLDPELYEELPNGFLRGIVTRALPGVPLRFRTTPEGYLSVRATDGSVRLDIGMSVAGGDIGFNIENAYLTQHQGTGAMTQIIKDAYQAVERKYGRPQSRSLNVMQDRGHGVWQAIANKVGAEYGAHSKMGESAEQDVAENFADGKGPGRPGDSQRHGIPKKATMAELEKASHAKGRKGQLARWQLNMRRGRKK
jgi:hypothetical protein